MRLTPIQNPHSEGALWDYRHRKMLNRRSKLIERKTKKLNDEIRRLEKEGRTIFERVRSANGITHVVEGIVLHCHDTKGGYGPGFRFNAPGLNRYVEGYTAASGKEGVAMKGRDYAVPYSQEHFFGFRWTIPMAKYVGMMWLVYGVHPTKEDELRRDWLFKNDPNGVWDHEERMAMEAAWRLGDQ